VVRNPAIGLSGFALVLSVAWLVLGIAVPFTGGGRFAFAVGYIAVPVLLVLAAIVSMLREREGWRPARTRLILVLGVIMSTAIWASFVAFSSGFDEDPVDGSVPAIAELSLPLAGISAVLIAVVIALIMSAALPRGTRQVVLTVLTAVIGGPVLAVLLLTPSAAIGLEVGTFAIAVSRAPRVPRTVRTPAPVSAVDLGVAVVLARALGVFAAAFLAITWTIGFANSIALTGTEGQTSSIGAAVAAAHLAAVPLLAALTALIVITTGRRTLWLATGLVSVAVVASSAVLIAFNDPASDVGVTVFAAISASVGVWIAIAAAPRLPFVGVTRVVVVPVVALIGAIAYFWLVGMWGAGTLIVPALVLAIRPRLVLRRLAPQAV